MLSRNCGNKVNLERLVTKVTMIAKPQETRGIIVNHTARISVVTPVTKVTMVNYNHRKRKNIGKQDNHCNISNQSDHKCTQFFMLCVCCFCPILNWNASTDLGTNFAVSVSKPVPQVGVRSFHAEGQTNGQI